LPPEGLTELNRISSRRRLAAGAAVLHEGEPADWCGIIMSGAVKLVKSTADGREQIVAVQFPSEFVGHPFSEPLRLRAEAATTVDLCCFPRNAIDGLTQKHPGLGRALLEDTTRALDAAREWMLTLGRKSAEEKVASFLLYMLDRGGEGHACSERSPQPETSLELPLSRGEIGQFLGLRIETISRQLRALRDEGIVRTSGSRRITVIDVEGLRRRAESESGPSAE
jgi:CRP/FNR family transcriptional regulator